MKGGDSRGGSMPGIFVNVHSFIICSHAAHVSQHSVATHQAMCILSPHAQQAQSASFKFSDLPSAPCSAP